MFLFLICPKFFSIVPHQVTGVQPKDVQYNSNLSLIITWNRPSSEASILYYEVQYWENRRLQPTVKAYGEQITLNGTVGRIYIVRVRAVSTVGGGPWSESDGRKYILQLACYLLCLCNPYLQLLKSHPI